MYLNLYFYLLKRYILESSLLWGIDIDPKYKLTKSSNIKKYLEIKKTTLNI